MVTPGRKRFDNQVKAVMHELLTAGVTGRTDVGTINAAITRALGTRRTDRLREFVRAMDVCGYIEPIKDSLGWRIRYDRAGIQITEEGS